MDALEAITHLKEELDSLRPLPTSVVAQVEQKLRLEQADKTENLSDFIGFIASCCKYALNLYIAAARGESIDHVDDLDKEIALFKGSLANASEEATQ